MDGWIFLTAVGLATGGSNTLHIYIQTFIPLRPQFSKKKKRNIEYKMCFFLIT